MTPAVSEEIVARARFLIVRLDEWERDLGETTDVETDYIGHVHPAKERLRAALSAALPLPVEGVDEPLAYVEDDDGTKHVYWRGDEHIRKFPGVHKFGGKSGLTALYSLATPAAGPSAVAVKAVCTAFFRWWWNKPGNNTDEGFDEWAATDGKDLLSALATLAPSAAPTTGRGPETEAKLERDAAIRNRDKFRDEVKEQAHFIAEAKARATALEKALEDARFAIETTVACLNTWNGGRGGPADTDGILARIDALLSAKGGET
jgi:hypothetical protein